MEAIVAKISESKKSACVMLKTSEFSMQSIPVYIPNKGYNKGDKITIPDHLKVVDWEGHATKDGVVLKTLSA